MYNYAPNTRKRWSYAEVDTEVLYRHSSPGYTLDELDSIDTDIDALPYSLDSRFYTGNNDVLAAFTGNDKLGVFTGSALSATIETGEASLNQGRRAELTMVKPVVDGYTTNTIQASARDTRADTQTFGSAVSLNSTGEAPLRSNGFYHAVRNNLTGNFTNAKGFYADFVDVGAR